MNSFKERAPATPEKLSFEEALAEKGVRIEPGEHHEAVIDTETFKAALNERQYITLEKLVRSIAIYLRYGIVTDTIEDHEDRRMWRQQMRNTYGEQADVLFENRLSANLMTPFYLYTTDLVAFLSAQQQHTQVTRDLLIALQRIVTLMTTASSEVKFGTEYRKSPLNTKVAKVREISAALKDLLAFAAHPVPQELPKAA